MKTLPRFVMLCTVMIALAMPAAAITPDADQDAVRDSAVFRFTITLGILTTGAVVVIEVPVDRPAEDQDKDLPPTSWTRIKQMFA